MIALIAHLHILASGTLGGSAPAGGNTNAFWNTDLGGATAALLAALGVVVVIIGVVKAILDAIGGKAKGSFKALLVALILGAFLIYPAMIGDLISAVATLVHDAVNTFSQLTGGSGGNNAANNITNVGG